MRRFGWAVAGVLSVLTVASPAVAITNGVADGQAHPNVGGLGASR
jgi:hypothetical protein